jgi:anti-anti-sigma regulatory factor/anti-sigma regulatory factor (Ser/Thr protein kinase)
LANGGEAAMSDLLQHIDRKTFDDLLHRCNPFADGSCVFDLRDAQFISSAALVQLAAAAYAVHRNGGRLTLRVEDQHVRTYLIRSGFVAAIDSVADIDPPYDVHEQHRFDHLHGSNPLLLEVTKIDSGAALPPLLDRIVALLRVRLRYGRNDAYDIATVISEVAQNTFDHNAATCGFLAVQSYRPKRGRRFVEIGVADFGNGLRATLQRNPKLSVRSDQHAITLAARLGVSQHDDPTRGTGLHHLLRLAYEHEGSVQIRSGTGKVAYRGDKRQGWGFTVPTMPGVQIAISVRTRAT